ncbi:Topoisomerase II-associated protein PAT1 [Rhynchospora pubera]|uniref:Topoisomerase II-associated protein PAT1 n=1 Tax=Rhynchospora pubera TaxID=906938 RepID=A0AAV8CT03_9POAL|nr:Topoisomerase II-associated protein PAT1 [Rhynchospora pubera]KAJ4811421.1 Topoisomerase II-associated protein PAT1 [Rhynchospora pubera]
MSSSGHAHFDASQYPFFGKDILEEVELGGLEEPENDETAAAPPDYEFHFSTGHKGLADTYASISHIDDLSSTFAKLNRAVSDPVRPGGLIVNGSSISRDSSSTLDLIQEADYLSWPDLSQTFAALHDSDTMIWRSQLPSTHHLSDSRPLFRTSSSPQQPPSNLLRHTSLLDPNLATSSAFQPHQPSLLTRHSSIPTLSSNHPSVPTLPCPSYANYDLGNLRSSVSFISQDHNVILPSFLNQQIQNYSSHNPSVLLDSPHHRSVGPKVRSIWSKQKDPSQTSGTGVSKFRSKYMSVEELESVARMFDSKAHGDQYIKDYYHQACLSKTGMQTQFCPSSVRDIAATTHTSLRVKEMHAILSCGSNVGGTRMKRPQYTRPLEKEPMFAARILVEDGFTLLLDVDDIDRFIQHTVQRNSISELRKHRQILLEWLATSLQLVDPLGSFVVCNPLNDDLVFLLIVSLPKGRELVTRYLRLIPPGTELSRVVCMAVFRHLRALFGVMASDKAVADTASKLAKTVSRCVQSFEISALSACLAAVVCSSEQPPLRPIGSSAGDGASIALKSVLDRATNLLSNPFAPARYVMSTINLWQASFDAFFTLLMNYCVSKLESILQQFYEPSAADMAKTIGREMPIELLHAILPHTNESQRKMLLDFVRRYMPGVPLSSESLLG